MAPLLSWRDFLKTTSSTRHTVRSSEVHGQGARLGGPCGQGLAAPHRDPASRRIAARPAVPFGSPKPRDRSCSGPAAPSPLDQLSPAVPGPVLPPPPGRGSRGCSRPRPSRPAAVPAPAPSAPRPPRALGPALRGRGGRGRHAEQPPPPALPRSPSRASKIACAILEPPREPKPGYASIVGAAAAGSGPPGGAQEPPLSPTPRKHSLGSGAPHPSLGFPAPPPRPGHRLLGTPILTSFEPLTLQAHICRTHGPSQPYYQSPHSSPHRTWLPALTQTLPIPRAHETPALQHGPYPPHSGHPNFSIPTPFPDHPVVKRTPPPNCTAWTPPLTQTFHCPKRPLPAHWETPGSRVTPISP